jgi:nitrogen fixation protein FixH
MKKDSKTTQKKSKIPYIFIGFFVVIVLVNIFYIYLSKSTWHGIYTSDSYHKGLQYNTAIKLAKKQEDLGWNMQIQYRRISETRGAFMIGLRDKYTKPINDAKIFINFKRPSQEGLDFSEPVDFKNGVYQVLVNFPFKGQWDVEVVVQRGSDIFQQVKRYVIE